jgi:hypothetical protein
MTTGGVAFWRRQLVHQLPMIVTMSLMLLVGRSGAVTIGIVLALVLVSMTRARAARISTRSRELIVDLWAMALVIVVPLFGSAAGHTDGSGMGMPPASLNSGLAVAIVLVAWVLARFAMAGVFHRGSRIRAESVVSGGCCAAGLLIMIVV